MIQALAVAVLLPALVVLGDDALPPEWRLLQSLADKKGFRADFDAVALHLQQMVLADQRAVGRTVLPLVAKGLSEPWSVPAIARGFEEPLVAAATDQRSLAECIGDSAGWLALDLAHAEADEPKLAELDALWSELAPDAVGPSENEELLDQLSHFMASSHDLLVGVTSGLKEEERTLLFTRFPDWCEAFFRVHVPKGEIPQEQAALIEAYKALALRVDRARLFAVARRVARLADPRFVATLGKRLAKTTRAKNKGAEVDGFSGDVIATVGTGPEDRVVLLGAGKTTISGRAALVIDLGGDDTWESAAVVDSPDALARVVIELDGNDRYVSTTPGPAYAVGGVALLVDARGHDVVEAGRLSAAASAFGVAALVDRIGNDDYRSADFAQGYTFCGGAFLIDQAGNDRYDAFAYAQGADDGNGIAALADGGGDDRYVANGHWPDVYGDSGSGSFHGASQGYGFGFRDGDVLLGGGIGVLADAGNGKDYYESGNFSQGGGYFLSFGLMYDGGGNDENHGYRYSQGFGVHQAIGVRWDAGGDDSYSTKCAANCGAGWDEGVGWLIDDGGNDQYDVGGLALGGTANSAVAILVDRGGDDRYGGGGGNDSQGGSGDSTYHTFQAIGALLDFGGGKDSYTRVGQGAEHADERADDRARCGDWFGLFLDAKEKSAAELLTPSGSKRLDQLLAPKAKPDPKKPTPKH